MIEPGEIADCRTDSSSSPAALAVRWNGPKITAASKRLNAWTTENCKS